MLYTYQFYLESSEESPLNLDGIEVEYSSIINEFKGAGLIRVAFDLISLEPSITLLYEGKKELIESQSNELKAYLKNHISVTDRMDIEHLIDEQRNIAECHHDHECNHGHGQQHHHEHDQQRDHGHGLQHDHGDGQQHGHGHDLQHDHGDGQQHHHGHDQQHDQQHGHGQQHDQQHDHGHGHSHEHSHQHNHVHKNKHWLKAALGLSWGLGLIILSLTSFNLPLLAYYAITGLSTLMTLYLGHTTYLTAWRALWNKKWDMSTLYTISTITIVGMSIASLLIPGLPMMLEAAPLVLGFWHLGEAVEHTLLDEINDKLDIRDCVAATTTLKDNTSIAVNRLIPNDIIIINSNEVIPADGVLTTSALLYTTRIDGSPYPKEFKAGDKVKAGMTLATHISNLEMRVSKTYQNSYLSLIAKNIKQAHDEKAPVEVFANKILQYFVPALLVVAALSGLIIGTLFTPVLAIQCVISVLVSACPCALSLITPLAVKIGMKKAAEQGIHFKNGSALQASADIDTVVFDLNGTLTKGEVRVENISIDDEQFLKHVALLESSSAHPVGKIITSHLTGLAHETEESLEITDIDASHHSGIKAVIDGVEFMVGNRDMLAKYGITEIKFPYNDPVKGHIYIVRASTVIGQIKLVDPLRSDAKATIQQLQSQGKAIHLCTGADRLVAEHYASLLGIAAANICANTVGADNTDGEKSKADYIKDLKKMGCKVAMIGDAANDITALASADIGIAVKSSIGDKLTEQHAGIVVQQGLLFPIATSFDVAKKTKDNIKQNLFVSLAYNSTITLIAAGLFVALGFALNPAVGVALMVVESAIVLGNLYRLKQQELIAPKTSLQAEVDESLSDSTSVLLHGLGHTVQAKADLTAASEQNGCCAHHHSPKLSNSSSGYGLFGLFSTQRTFDQQDGIAQDLQPH